MEPLIEKAHKEPFVFCCTVEGVFFPGTIGVTVPYVLARNMGVNEVDQDQSFARTFGSDIRSSVPHFFFAIL